jgi:hypothetical protein
MNFIIGLLTSTMVYASANPRHDLSVEQLTETSCGAVFFSAVSTAKAQPDQFETPVFAQSVDEEIKGIEAKFSTLLAALPPQTPDSKKSEALLLIQKALQKSNSQLAQQCRDVMKTPVQKCFSLYQTGAAKDQYEDCARTHIDGGLLQNLMHRVLRSKSR